MDEKEGTVKEFPQKEEAKEPIKAPKSLENAAKEAAGPQKLKLTDKECKKLKELDNEIKDIAAMAFFERVKLLKTERKYLDLVQNKQVDLEKELEYTLRRLEKKHSRVLNIDFEKSEIIIVDQRK